MKLYLIENISENRHYYDAYRGFVIAANSETEARKIANECPGDEGSIWEDCEKVSCKEIGEYTGELTEPMIVLYDFNAG